MDAVAAHQRDVVWGVDATFGHQQAPSGHLFAQTECGVERDRKRPQAAVVDAQHRRRHAQGTLELGGVVHLHQHVHAEFAGEAGVVGELGVVERGHDQQHAVSAEQARLVHLPGIDQEVLAQRRQRAGAAGGT